MNTVTYRATVNGWLNLATGLLIGDPPVQGAGLGSAALGTSPLGA